MGTGDKPGWEHSCHTSSALSKQGVTVDVRGQMLAFWIAPKIALGDLYGYKV